MDRLVGGPELEVIHPGDQAPQRDRSGLVFSVNRANNPAGRANYYIPLDFQPAFPDVVTDVSDCRVREFVFSNKPTIYLTYVSLFNYLLSSSFWPIDANLQ